MTDVKDLKASMVLVANEPIEEIIEFEQGGEKQQFRVYIKPLSVADMAKSMLTFKDFESLSEAKQTELLSSNSIQNLSQRICDSKGKPIFTANQLKSNSLSMEVLVALFAAVGRADSPKSKA